MSGSLLNDSESDRSSSRRLDPVGTLSAQGIDMCGENSENEVIISWH